MATVLANNYLKAQFLQNDPQVAPKPISAMELSGIFMPESLGYVMSEEMGKGSLLAKLALQGREFQVSQDQVMWREEGDMLRSMGNKATFTNATNTFAVSPTTFPTVAGNIDTAIPTGNAKWVGIAKGLRFTAFDSTGVQNWGVIDTVASNGETFTAKVTGDDASDFTIGTDVEVMFTNYNLDDCECPPCIAIKDWSPTLENTLAKDGVCVEYCEETMIKEAVEFDYIETPDGKVSLDGRLSDAQKVLSQRNEITFAFDKKLTQTEATALGKDSLGTDGVFTILDKRATKIQGELTTMTDVNLLIKLLKDNKIYDAMLYCTSDQYSKLQALFPPNTAWQIDPFANHETDLIHYGFGGFRINGVTIRFAEWTAMDDGAPYAGKKYHFLVVPQGNLSRLINGKRETVGYLNAAYFAGNGKVWKMLRSEDPNNGGYCGLDKINYFNKVAPVVFMAHKFILGVA